MTNYNRTGIGYLQVRPHGNYRQELKVVKVTQKHPDIIEPGCVVIKLRVQVPDAAFGPLQPEVDVVVALAHAQLPVVVETLEPDELEED